MTTARVIPLDDRTDAIQPAGEAAADRDLCPALKAVIFDVDGTLYGQQTLRAVMLGRLLVSTLRHPVVGWRTIRILRAYRRAHEHLRTTAWNGDLASVQVALAATRVGVDQETVSASVKQWMEEIPLPLLSRYVRPGASEFLRKCRQRGLRIAALSDYPADAKLEAMRLRSLFDVVLCAQAPQVNALKPDPRGLLAIIQELGVSPAECMYIGDRHDVDAPAAYAAGVRCAILSSRATKEETPYVTVQSYAHLERALWS